MKKRYGLTKEDYNDLLAAQNGGCAICLNPETQGRKLSVDHCHATNEIRGLLCSKCNAALGLLNDDTNILINAINYLK